MVLNNVAWVGRLTGPKGEIAWRIISEVAPQFPKTVFTIVGGPVTERFRAAAGHNVHLQDFVSDVDAVYRASDLVIGAGRVAIEAMQLGRPVIAVGENRYIGPVDGTTIALAKATNFGDCDRLHPFDTAAMIRDLKRLASGAMALPVGDYPGYLDDYRLNHVYPRVMAVYREALVDAALQPFAEVPVLTYHRVLTERPAGSRFNIYVTVDELEQQMLSLKQRGFQFVTFRDIADGVRPKKPVILSFDDGYEDNHRNLLPLLKKHAARAVIYVLGDRTITDNHWDIAQGEPAAALMSDEQLLECHRSGLVEIGAHGMTHRKLTQLDVAALGNDVSASKTALESLIGDEVVSFAYPYGVYADREVAAVRSAGYLFGVGTVNGPVRMADDRMRVRRITMFPGTDRLQFRKKTSGWYLRYCRLKGKDF
ncbi:MAG: polysaccharide deacetylase [Gammaproteobacteria bacterium]|nr:MAG: polysaccharide deacetylase [Gammaproteobacteria bacterium]TND05850.1 MAG: polysaccharide deacetylase [Gammaproteobacteria bacterium]